MEYHFHHCEPYRSRLDLGQAGILIDRQQAMIRRPTRIGESFVINGETGTDLYEFRSSLCLNLVQVSGTYAYSVLVLVDDTLNFISLPDKRTWQKYGIIPCGKAVGIAQFQVMIVLLVKHWEKQWEAALDAIDGTIRVKLDDIRDDERWNGLMFDNSFELSKLYFSVLQLLRIITEWIEESITDLRDLRERYALRKRFLIQILKLGLDDISSTEKNWDTVIATMELPANRLLDRINRKAEEVKSLRDGLFNATSLREATKSLQEASKGIALNRAIYVFTVVTVIYTPLGFVSALWALPILNNDSDNGAETPRAAFISTFILIPLLTYVIALFAVGYFSLESSKRSFNSENSQKVIGAGFELMWATWEEVTSYPSIVSRRIGKILEKVRGFPGRGTAGIPAADLPLSSRS
ncbi:hypothetical protein K449DRAFT_389502 [Hypoxylon sp. EC38]|nr:hypothetical protein K449DRAFT_389502 [Hypoxylon sp. EC38]